MGNVLNQISEDNTRFTIFKNNQVLTADQLNDLFNYLDVQSKLTRTKAIGVGIIYGLEIGVVDGKSLVVSSGAAITTDGDLLHFDDDQQFDQYEIFEDLNAKYPYFLNDSEQPLPIFHLIDSTQTGAVKGKKLSDLESATSTSFSDYIGILYLEDYYNNPDLCTGKDCDNKGSTAMKNVKVLLIHKNNIGALLQSLPQSSIDYFAMEELNISRVKINTEIDTYKELNASFNNALTVRKDIETKLNKAYQICKIIVDQDLPNGDPTTIWADLFKAQFDGDNSYYAQYLYDYARDLGYAYNELKESLFVDDSLTDPAVDLFPKHILLGNVREANLTRPIPKGPNSIGGLLSVAEIPSITAPLRNLLAMNFLKTSALKFNFKLLTKRFNKVNRALDYRHHFYESPILNSNNDADKLTRFNFMRIHCMISNFKIPTSTSLRDSSSGLKITPSFFEDVALGERTIPFYYSYNTDFPINLYWNFEANKRKKENQLLYYSAEQYTQDGAVITPFNYNILKYNFFRIEGHIGFVLSDVEKNLNKIILDNNLPMNIISVQVEKKLDTIPPRKWFFPHLYMYEKSVKSTFFDRMDNAGLVNEELVKATDTTVTNIPSSEFKTAAQNVRDNAADVDDTNFDYAKYRSAVSNVMTAASNVKAQTKQFAFSNTAIPHDFILNSDLLRKTDVIAGIYNDTIIKKKTGLMLGNFMKDNPGLEHAGGVLRGGTFVLVYTADDKKVVADFMLPYANIDKDIVKDPPKYTPIPMPLPDIPKIPRFPLNNVFELTPIYVKNIDTKLGAYIKDSDLEEKINVKITRGLDDGLKVVNTKLDGFSTRLNENSNLFTKILVPTKATIPSNVGTKDFGMKEKINALTDAQTIMESFRVGSTERIASEKEYLKNAGVVVEALSKSEITNDASNTLQVAATLSQVQVGYSLITDAGLKTESLKGVDKVNNVVRGLKFDR